MDRLKLFESTRFSFAKGSDTKRIFCLGGSTTQGEPYKPPTAFPAWLQRNLELIAPSQRWEAINCGGLSYVPSLDLSGRVTPQNCQFG